MGFGQMAEMILNVYMIDMDEQKLVKDEMIHTVPAVENGWSDLRMVNDLNSIGQKSTFCLR